MFIGLRMTLRVFEVLPSHVSARFRPATSEAINS
jgi:hypothetical protein